LILSAQTPAIFTQVSPTVLCAGDSMYITFTTSDTFESDNVFTILLSDSTGSFDSPDTLDTIQDQVGETLSIHVPVIPGSPNYYIAVTASDPAATGVSNVVYIRPLLAPPNTHLTYSTANLCTGDSVTLHIDSLPHVTYTWYFRDTARIDTNHYSYVAKKPGEYGVLFTDTSAAGCSTAFDSVLISMFPYPAKPTVTAVGHPNICGSGTVIINSVDNDTASLTYQWVNHDDTVAGATSSTYGASTSGVYSLVVSAYGCSAISSDSVAINIASVPTVSFQLPDDSFCLYGPNPQLSGGSPASGGYYSGNFVSGSQFVQTQSGLGNFVIYYTVVDTIGCHSTDSATIIILDCTTAITETGSQPAISLYPNPASDMVTITISEPGTVSLRVLNLVGQTMSTQLFTGELHYSVQNLPAGAYMLEMTGPSESWRVVEKLIVE
jgi:hypothetical protein